MRELSKVLFRTNGKSMEVVEVDREAEIEAAEGTGETVAVEGTVEVDVVGVVAEVVDVDHAHDLYCQKALSSAEMMLP